MVRVVGLVAFAIGTSAAYTSPPRPPLCRAGLMTAAPFGPAQHELLAAEAKPFSRCCAEKKPPLLLSRKMPRLHALRGGTVTASLALPALQPEILRSSLNAVLELLTCCSLGAFATRIGLLDAPTTRGA